MKRRLIPGLSVLAVASTALAAPTITPRTPNRVQTGGHVSFKPSATIDPAPTWGAGAGSIVPVANASEGANYTAPQTTPSGGGTDITLTKGSTVLDTLHLQIQTAFPAIQAANITKSTAYPIHPGMWQEEAATAGTTGTAYVVWQSKSGTSSTILMQRTTDYGVTWLTTPVTLVSTPNALDTMGITVDALHTDVVYLTYSEGGNDVGTEGQHFAVVTHATTTPSVADFWLGPQAVNASLASPNTGGVNVFTPTNFGIGNWSPVDAQHPNLPQMGQATFTPPAGWNPVAFVDRGVALDNFRGSATVAPRMFGAGRNVCLTIAGRRHAVETSSNVYVTCTPSGAFPQPTRIYDAGAQGNVDDSAGYPVGAYGTQGARAVEAVAFGVNNGHEQILVTATDAQGNFGTPTVAARNLGTANVLNATGGVQTSYVIHEPQQPDVKFDAEGTLWLAYRAGLTAGNPSALIVQKSFDLGATWSEAVIVSNASSVGGQAQYPAILSFGKALSVVDYRPVPTQKEVWQVVPRY